MKLIYKDIVFDTPTGCIEQPVETVKDEPVPQELLEDGEKESI